MQGTTVVTNFTAGDVIELVGLKTDSLGPHDRAYGNDVNYLRGDWEYPADPEVRWILEHGRGVKR